MCATWIHTIIDGILEGINTHPNVSSFEADSLVIGFLADFNGRHNLCPTLEVMRVLISYFVSTNIFVVNVMLVLSSGIIINILTVSFLWCESVPNSV